MQLAIVGASSIRRLPQVLMLLVSPVRCFLWCSLPLVLPSRRERTCGPLGLKSRFWSLGDLLSSSSATKQRVLSNAREAKIGGGGLQHPGRFRLCPAGAVWMMDGGESCMQEMSGRLTALRAIDRAPLAAGQRGFLPDGGDRFQRFHWSSGTLRAHRRFHCFSRS